MLVTFSCDAYENITLFGAVAIRLLKMMGHSGTVPGALLAHDVPAALRALQQAIEHEKKHASPQATDDEDEPEVSIVHRAIPLLRLLQAAAQQDCNVMWK